MSNTQQIARRGLIREAATSGIERSFGAEPFPEGYSSIAPYAIAHGLSKAPKIFYFWTGQKSKVDSRRYVGGLYAENMLMPDAENHLTEFAPVLLLSANAVAAGTQSLYAMTAVNGGHYPDDTYIYLWIASTANPIPAGTTVYWEALTW